jgi:hypothetical protein
MCKGGGKDVLNGPFIKVMVWNICVFDLKKDGEASGR